MDPYDTSCHRAAFFKSDMFKHLTVGLDTVLKNCRQHHHVPSTALLHIADIQDEKKPKLGVTMKFEECDNEDGNSCPKEARCFNPNFSATNYLDKFLREGDRFNNALETNDLSRNEFTRLYDLSSVPSGREIPWMTAVVNVFRDLWGQQLEM